MDTKKNLYQKILDVYNEVHSIVKDSEVKVSENRSYMAISHDAVTKALHAPIARAGIVVRPNQKSCNLSTFEITKNYNGKEQVSTWYKVEMLVELSLINADNPDEILTTELFSYAIDTSDKAVGKAYSMAIKNMYLKLFLLESADQEEERVFDEYNQPKGYSPKFDQRQEKTKQQVTQYKTVEKTQPEPNKKESGPVNHAPQVPNGISYAQIKRLFALAKEALWTEEQLRNYLNAVYEKTAFNELNKEEFGYFTRTLEAKVSYKDAVEAYRQVLVKQGDKNVIR